ncbi:MAG: sigma-70 family RNA polymerase sigma factor [Candidatus Binatia bacterium]|nr:sigma-70 family RNA polymerase sigma factor [Candidatus Binatia bacterium]
MPAAPQIPWNIVTKELECTAALQRQVRQRIAKLGRLLRDFPPDAVHLQVVLTQQPKPPCLRAALTLRLPSHILHGEKAAATLEGALTGACAVLQRRLEALKAKMAHAAVWKRKQRRARLRQGKTGGFAPAPLAAGTGPQTLRDVASAFLQHHYGRLLRHVRRHIRHDEWAGEIPPGAVDPRSVIDEVCLQVLSAPEQKPPAMGWLVWVYHLVHEELRRRRNRVRQQTTEEVSLEARPSSSRETAPVQESDFTQPLTFAQTVLEPPGEETEAPSLEVASASPEEVVAAKEIVESLQEAIQTWSRPEREVFELYFVEGFEPDEIALITGRPLQKVRLLITALQHRLRQELML